MRSKIGKLAGPAQCIAHQCIRNRKPAAVGRTEVGREEVLQPCIFFGQLPVGFFKTEITAEVTVSFIEMTCNLIYRRGKKCFMCFAGITQQNDRYYLQQQKAEKGKVAAYEEEDVFQGESC